MKKWIVIGSAMMIIAAIVLVVGLFQTEKRPMSFETFQETMHMEEQTATIGANVTLHQIIHGTHGKTYRYKLATDCPHWTYEGRYESRTPLSFDLEAAAIETNATEVQIYQDSECVLTAQYFELPLLGITSESKTYTDWKDEQIQKAYEQKVEEVRMKDSKFRVQTLFLDGFLWLIGIAAICQYQKQKSGKGTALSH